MRTIPALVLLVLSGLACRAPLSGGPGVALVVASRSAHDLMAERWKAYVRADAKLDPLTADQLAKVPDDWELAIEAAEEAIAPDYLQAPAPAGLPR